MISVLKNKIRQMDWGGEPFERKKALKLCKCHIMRCIVSQRPGEISLYTSLLVPLQVLLKKIQNGFRKHHDFPRDIVAVNPMRMIPTK